MTRTATGQGPSLTAWRPPDTHAPATSFEGGNSTIPRRGWSKVRILAASRRIMRMESSRMCDSGAEDEGLQKPERVNGFGLQRMFNVGKSSNILWHKCSVEKADREQLLGQRGCVIWITGLSGSGKSTLACALAKGLHARGKLTYILDGDNVRHGLNSNLSFKAEDRAENIRRMGEVAKLFADAGVICIASLISPYRKDREFCRSLLNKGEFIEVFMDVPLSVCESRDPKGLYKLARAGQIQGFTGVDDPYEPPQSCEVVLKHKGGNSASPDSLAETILSYLEENGYLKAS